MAGLLPYALPWRSVPGMNLLNGQRP
jgi:hypothetical protein